jgi:hypothetical protein
VNAQAVDLRFRHGFAHLLSICASRLLSIYRPSAGKDLTASGFPVI